MRFSIVKGLCLFGLLASLPAAAAIHSDTFWVGLAGGPNDWNVLSSPSGGSGWDNGHWLAYGPVAGQYFPSDPWGNEPPGNPKIGVAAVTPVWLNQWFYDDPYDPTRWKTVKLEFDYKLLNIANRGGVDVIINWTLPNWPNTGATGAPPLPGQGDQYIGRLMVGHLWLDPNDTGNPAINGHFVKTFDLRDYQIPYNPEWISIDVAGYNVLLSSPDAPGSIIHECVPEPGSLALVGFGAMGLMLRRRQA